VSARRWLDRPAAGVTGGALLLLSVSRFEIVTAAFGRQTGDALLKIVARRIERLALRGERLVARMAGAEFAVGLPGPVTTEEAEFLGRSLADAAGRPFVAGEHVVELAVHVGIAVATPGEDGTALLRRASGALAEAKATEGDPVRLLTERREAETAAANQLEVDLRTALAEGQIELLYQPQIGVTTGVIVGVEALARWRHPRLGELGAETLFAAAERSDYLVQLSRHVQERVVAEVVEWPEMLSRLRIAINVTAVEMALPDFASGFLARLDKGGLARGRVTVEVTESGLIEDLTAAAAMLARLRAGGCRVAIDDFGTGYSSLAYLKALPLDYLKIDKKLAQDITGSARDRVVVRGAIDMARSLGLVVIAEGVETAQQLSLLAQEGCNIYQGYLSAPPLDLAALTAMVAAQTA
jgi:diguanylate cyclase (GGDEF)-like protein